MSDTNQTAAAAPDKSARKPDNAAAPTQKMAPEDWARSLGTVVNRKRFMTLKTEHKRYEAFPIAHNCAAVLHGWAEHKHHTGADIQLTRAEYEAALSAAGEPAIGGADHGKYKPHAAALSPHHGKGR